MTCEKTPCRTFLLDDIPAPEDEFASDGSPGPHQRVADAIVELISSVDEQGGKVIGLEGGWGSGKSTVVKFIRNRLEQQKHYTVIPFDAWAHEGDPLRRTYLETVIRYLHDCEWIEKDRWDKKKKEIANRRKVTHTKTIPKTTKLGTWLSLSLFGVPVGTTLLASGLNDGIVFDTSASIAHKFVFGFLLSFAPFLVLLTNAAYIVFKGPVSWKRIWESPKRVFNHTNWPLLEGKAISDTTTETVETPNPTSIEFERYFTDAMRRAADGNIPEIGVCENGERHQTVVKTGGPVFTGAVYHGRFGGHVAIVSRKAVEGAFASEVSRGSLHNPLRWEYPKNRGPVWLGAGDRGQRTLRARGI